jgi:hypothetical protein
LLLTGEAIVPPCSKPRTERWQVRLISEVVLNSRQRMVTATFTIILKTKAWCSRSTLAR